MTGTSEASETSEDVPVTCFSPWLSPRSQYPLGRGEETAAVRLLDQAAVIGLLVDLALGVSHRLVGGIDDFRRDEDDEF